MLFKRASSLSAVPMATELPANAPLISTRGIEKSYPVGPGQTYVLRRITVDIKPWRVVSIWGGHMTPVSRITWIHLDLTRAVGSLGERARSADRGL